MASAAKPARVLVMDWDETITRKDTTFLVAQAASGRNLGPSFSHYTRVYMDAYEKYNSKWGARKTVEEETEYHRGMREVEMSLISALERDGYFKGISRSDIAAQAKKVELASGFRELVEHVQKNWHPLYILSVNWSVTLIEEALRLAKIPGIKVLANELEFDENGKATGQFDRSLDIRTGYDKVQQLAKIRNCHPNSQVIYVGDSSGDVLPIVDADVGIVIEGGRGKAQLEKLGIPVRQLEFLDKGRTFEASWETLLHRS